MNNNHEHWLEDMEEDDVEDMESEELQYDEDEIKKIEKLLSEELGEDYHEEEDSPWEFIEDIPGLSELLEGEDSEKYLDEEFPGLMKLKKKDK